MSFINDYLPEVDEEEFEAVNKVREFEEVEQVKKLREEAEREGMRMICDFISTTNLILAVWRCSLSESFGFGGVAYVRRSLRLRSTCKRACSVAAPKMERSSRISQS